MLKNCEGQFVKIRRNGGPHKGDDNKYYITQVRLYESPNLLESPTQVSITGPEPTKEKYEVKNLINNLDTRTSSSVKNKNLWIGKNE